MSNITGHIREKDTKKGKSYQLVVEFPSKNGKRERKYQTFHGTKKQAQKRLQELIYELEHGTYIEPTKTTVNSFLEEWMKTYVIPSKKETTSDGYQKIIDRYITDTIGGTVLEDLTAIAVQKWINSLSEKSPVSNKPLSPQTVKNTFLVLHSAMEKAVELKLLKESPCKYTQLPKLVKYSASVLDEEELKEFLQTIHGTDLETPLMITITLGLRRGELLALKWSSINWDKKRIYITENRVQTPSNKILTQTPKSKAGIRSIVLPNNLFEYLRIEHDRLKLLDKTFSESDYIVHMNGSKEPYRPDVFSQKFKRFIARNHLKKIRFHDIRHTFATQMLASGVPAKVIQKILGHSEISTTLDTYTEVLQSVEDDVAEKINKKIFWE